MATDYRALPSNLAEDLATNAGILVTDWVSLGHSYTTILGATSGGVNVKIAPVWKDYGDGIDNSTKHIKELQQVTDVDATMAGTAKTIDASLLAYLIGCAKNTAGVISLSTAKDDYSFISKLTYVVAKSGGGGIAITFDNALSTDGFAIQSTDKDLAAFAFTFTAHSTLADPYTIPVTVEIWDAE